VIVYLDSSVVLRPLLAQANRLHEWGPGRLPTPSELLGVECRRAIDRLRLEGLYDDKQVAQAAEALVRMEQTIRRIKLNSSIVR
jgi:hypothetical protein